MPFLYKGRHLMERLFSRQFHVFFPDSAVNPLILWSWVIFKVDSVSNPFSLLQA